MKGKFSKILRAGILLVLALSLSLIMATPAMAADIGGTITYTPSGSTVGTYVAASSTVATFDPTTAITAGSTITLTFPSGTALAAIVAGDFTIHQAASGGGTQGTATAPSSIGFDAGARTITFTVDAASLSTVTNAGLGIVTIATSGAAGGDEIRHPTTVTTTGVFGVATSVGDTGTISDVAFVHDVATQLVFTTQPAGSVSGIALTTQPIVEARDQYGNKDTTYTTDVVASEDDAGALTGTLTVTPVAGVATFTNLVYTATADGETFQINVNSGGLTQGISGDVVSDVVATKLVFTTQPAGSVSGIALTTQPIVQAQDAGNLLDVDYVTDVVASEDDAGALTGTLTVTPVAGVATFTDLVYTATADSQTFQINVNSVGLTEGISGDVVSDVVATKLLVTTAPANIVSGVSMTQPVVKYVDAADITDVDIDTDIITVSENGVGSLSGDTTATASNGVATFVGLVYSALADGEAVTFTFTDDVAGVDFSGAPVTSAQTADVLATKLVFTVQPAGSVSGIALTTQPVVQAQDAANMLDVDYVTNVVASEDDAGALTGTTTVTPVAGVATFTDLIYTATADGETFQINVNSGTLTEGISSDVVSDVVATKLVFTTQPAGSVSGAALTTQPIVQAQDAGSVLDVDYVTDVVASEDDAGTLTGTLTVTPVAGVATFTDLVYTATADSQTFQINVNSGTLTEGISNDVVSGVVATKLIIVTQPAGAGDNTAFVIQPVVHAVDANGVLDTDYTTAASVAKTTGAGTLTGADVNPMVAGVATFTGVKIDESPVTHDSYTLTFSSGTLTPAVSDAFKVFSKVVDLNDDAWTLISTDDYVISSGDNTSVFGGSVTLKYKHTSSGYLSATVADILPVEALYVKTTSDDGWAGLNYSTAGAPGASTKSLVAGWNLVSSATITDAGTVLSPLRYVQIGEQQGTGLATLVSQGTYNLNTTDWYIDATTWTNVTGNMNPFDGYWVYMNAAKSFGVIPQ